MLDRMTYLCEAVKCFQAPLDFNGRISQSTENKKDDRVALPRLTQRILSSQGWRFWLSFFTVHILQPCFTCRKLACPSGPSGQIDALGSSSSGHPIDSAVCFGFRILLILVTERWNRSVLLCVCQWWSEDRVGWWDDDSVSCLWVEHVISGWSSLSNSDTFRLSKNG